MPCSSLQGGEVPMGRAAQVTKEKKKRGVGGGFLKWKNSRYTESRKRKGGESLSRVPARREEVRSLGGKGEEVSCYG